MFKYRKHIAALVTAVSLFSGLGGIAVSDVEAGSKISAGKKQKQEIHLEFPTISQEVQEEPKISWATEQLFNDMRYGQPLQLNLLEAALNKGADVNARFRYGKYSNVTPLIATIMCGGSNKAQLVRLFLEHGADVNAKGANEWTPMHYAVYYGYSIEVVKLLIEHGADVNAKNLRGDTPLHSVAFHDYNGEMTKWLLISGADLHIRNNNNQTPLDYARNVFRGPEKVAALLHQAETAKANGEQAYEKFKKNLTIIDWASKFNKNIGTKHNRNNNNL